jgi:hypothetical protein
MACTGYGVVELEVSRCTVECTSTHPVDTREQVAGRDAMVEYDPKSSSRTTDPVPKEHFLCTTHLGPGNKYRSRFGAAHANVEHGE